MMPHPLEVWGGVECTCNRVGDRWFDQTIRSGHEWRIADLDAFASLGIRTLRYPVLWERVAPKSLDDCDWRWTDERLERMRQLGIRPIATLLHHGSGPRYTSLLDPDFPRKLARFAAAVARRYPWVEAYTVVNEPMTTARFSALYGHWYPHHRSDGSFVTAVTQQLRGTVDAMREIRRVVPHARLIQTEDCGRTFGSSDALASQVAFEEHRRWLTFDLLTRRVGPEHPLIDYLRGAGFSADDLEFFLRADCAPSVVGLNYYLTSDRYLDDRIDRYPPDLIGGNGRIGYADIEAVRGRPDGIVGHCAHLLQAWQRYGLPVAITETHLGCTREEQMRWLMDAWEGAQAARRAGATVPAVTVWALTGSYDWNTLVTCQNGYYEPGVFDTRSVPPRATALAGVITSLSTGQTATHPAMPGTGWWRRGRQSARRSPHVGGSAPLLILGGTGTLGQAFARICDRRGLPHVVTQRGDVDITQRDQVDRIIATVAPWAVVNATGYVRVDEAERDADACYVCHVTGVEHLGAACAQANARLMTFSTDLVFGNGGSIPRLEDDPTSPLNVYGATKAEAERRIGELLPEALVIRTSAFFGPWDRHNFVAHLFEALDRGEQFPAAADEIVSPTYVPELVDIALDLLIDGENGIWHLANRDAVSWYDFACLAATRSGRDASLVVPVTLHLTPGRARRPANSALASKRGRLMRPLDQALDAFLAMTDAGRTPSMACAST